MTRPVLRARFAAVAVVLAVALGGCTAPTATGARGITESEADRLADALYTNFQDGGASFTLSALTTTGATIAIDGDIDFTKGAGRADFTSTGSDASLVEVAWLGDTVLESIPTLVQLADAGGQGGFTWVARAADPQTYEVDAQLAIVRALGSEVRENPQLVRQSGARWLRSDTLRGVAVDVFQYGKNTKYWLAKDGSQLLRFEGNNSDQNSPVLVDLTDPGTRTIDLPTLEETVAVQDIADLYASARYHG